MAQTAKLFEINSEDQGYLESVRVRLLDYIRETGKSQSEIAKAIGFSSATMTGFIRNNYQGDMVEVANRIQDYLMRETQRAISPKSPEWAPTSFAKHALTVLSFAHVNRDMGMIHGDAGVGKTMTIEHYAAEHRNVIVVTAGVDLCSPKAVMEELLNQLGKDYGGSFSSMSRQVIQLLKGSDKLIVIDEANHLNFRAREAIRKIHDQTGVGIVYCGSHDLYAQLHGKRDIIYAQLLSRIGVRRGLNRNDLSINDISLVFEQHGKLDDQCLDLLYRCSISEGGLRLAKKIYVLASTMAFGDGQALNISYLQKAIQMAMADHVKL